MAGNSQGNPANAIPAYLCTGGGGKPLGYQQITGMSAATNLTPPTGATVAVIKAEAQAVRWRDDGTAPTSSIGMPLLVTDPTFIYTASLTAIQFIQETSGAILNVSYY